MKSRIELTGMLIVVLAAIGMIVHGPIPQLAHYHEFADQSVRSRIPHFYDVLSNLGFLVVGGYGCRILWKHRAHPELQAGWHGYMLFSVALILTAFCSSFYHLAPDNFRLIWDRIPIALACAGLLSAVRCETKSNVDGKQLTSILALFALGSVGWWYITDQIGVGDLRPYLLIQCSPLVLIPLWQFSAGSPKQDRLWFGVALAFYVVAKIAEINDHQLYAMTGWFSGHTLKHMLATAAAGTLILNFYSRTSDAVARNHTYFLNWIG